MDGRLLEEGGARHQRAQERDSEQSCEKDCNWAISKENLKSIDVSEMNSFIRRSTVSKKDVGMTWSMVERMFYFNQPKIDEAI